LAFSAPVILGAIKSFLFLTWEPIKKNAAILCQKMALDMASRMHLVWNIYAYTFQNDVSVPSLGALLNMRFPGISCGNFAHWHLTSMVISLWGQYQVLHHSNHSCRNKVEHNERRVAVPLFLGSYSVMCWMLSIPGIVKRICYKKSITWIL
jgi:hypothetical protein